MSVSKQIHDAIPMRPLDAAPPVEAASVRDKLALVKLPADAQTFWEEFNRTLDEFFRTINSAKNHIRMLNAKLAERDRRVELLEAENAALREQVELQRSPIAAPHAGSGTGRTCATESARSSHTAPPLPASGSKAGIWSKLNRLERDAGPLDLKE